MSLVKILVDSKLIAVDMLAEGKVLAKGLGATAHLVNKELRITAVNDTSFKCVDRLGQPFLMDFVNVHRIDGMDLDRFAAVYNIKADGSIKSTGKKRGRKPKSAQINTLEGDSNGKDKRTEGYAEAKQAFA